MNVTLSHCFVYVLDQDEALDFYTRVLGLEVHTDARMEHMRWLTVVSPEQPDLEINLFVPVSPPVAPDDVETLRALAAKGSLPSLIFRTDDVRATFERVRDAGADVLQEPIAQDYGVIDCAFRDPSGNMVRISQPIAAAAS
jgi:catechol 2,3-dioxygenase-like lactoylglutathione lyase family enzyme